MFLKLGSAWSDPGHTPLILEFVMDHELGSYKSATNNYENDVSQENKGYIIYILESI